MKIAFSTLACPNSSWAEVTSMASDAGYDGVELRGLGADIFAVRAKPFTPQELPATLETLERLKLEVPCVSSHCALKFAEKRAENAETLTAYIDLAAKLGAKYIRVLGDLEPAPDGEVDDALVASRLKELAPVAAERGVTLLVETNGVYSDTARLADLLRGVASDSVAALWDFHHPYRYAGESPEKTVTNLGAYIKYVHIKDSVFIGGKPRYKLAGEGDMPLGDMIAALRSVNYDGYVSLEWVKRWADELEDAGIAIPHFSHYMERYLGRETFRADSASGGGRGFGESDTLIDLTFPQLLDKTVGEYPEQTAFRFTTCDYTRTYSEFSGDVDAFARALIALGVKKGDKVAVWATNVPEWYVAFWASVKIGAVLVTVNTAYKIHEAEYLLRQSDTHTLVLTEGHKDCDYAGIIAEICPELEHSEIGSVHCARLPFLRNVISVGFSRPGFISWADALRFGERVSLDEVHSRAASLDRHDVCNIQYTSGTTGFPKGVMLTHYNVVNNGNNIGDRMKLSSDDRMLIHVPMFHCFGMVLAMTACVTHAASMFPIPAFSPRLSLACINSEKITAFHGVPTMFIAMLEHPDFASTDFSYMRTGIMAGSPCPVKVMRDVIDKMRMTGITIVFGQTESSPGCTMSYCSDDMEVKVNTVGSPLPGVECRIADPVTGETLPDDTDGEFVARGYNIMRGYYKMPAATAAAIDADGWLHTGDLARRTPDGNFKITGRIRDMIIRGGENIYPKEIEDFLYTFEKVRDVQVVGVPDTRYGEEICACIILKDGFSSSPEEVREFSLSRIAKHKVPRYVRFVDSFPMNAAGKILKYKMAEESADCLGL